LADENKYDPLERAGNRYWEMTKMAFKAEQKKRGLRLIQEGFFDDDPGGGLLKNRSYPFVLQDGLHNLHPSIRENVLAYFKENSVSWWGGKYPTGHVLSSQIACLNHLFPIRQDKAAVLNLLKSVTDDFVEVSRITEEMSDYVMFEAVGGPVNYLNEGANTRGSNCTSVDALVYAVHRDRRRFLLPIEWKYVEAYGNDDKSTGSKGETRKSRYLDLIANSKYLNENTLSCCWFEPFYQLMRQTLRAEQVLTHKPEGFEADDYLHLHIIPNANAELLDKQYPCSGKGMEATWKNCLTDPDKYIVLSPEKLWNHQDNGSAIYKYLKKRYW
jgi:hypothetical protein